MVEDLIPNLQLRLIVDWYSRQSMIKDDTVEEVEVKRGKEQDEKEKIYMINKIASTFSKQIVPISNE